MDTVESHYRKEIPVWLDSMGALTLMASDQNGRSKAKTLKLRRDKVQKAPVCLSQARRLCRSAPAPKKKKARATLLWDVALSAGGSSGLWPEHDNS